MRRLVFALTLLASPALAQTPAPAPPPPTAAESALIDEWSPLVAAEKNIMPMLANAERAVNAVLAESTAQRAQIAAIEAYWKAWCGDKPGCDVHQEPPTAQAEPPK
jgi:hypothetical protein